MSWFAKQAPPQGETQPWAQALVQQKQGALGQLGQGGLNTPQPVPGGAPRPFTPGSMATNDPGTPAFQPMGSLAALGTGQMPNVANFPNHSFMGVDLSQIGQMPDLSKLPNQSVMGVDVSQFGAPNLNQSGMVTLRSPNGRETQQVSAQDAAHWLSRGAVRM